MHCQLKCKSGSEGLDKLRSTFCSRVGFEHPIFSFVSSKILHDPVGMKTPAENLLQSPWHPSLNESRVWIGAEVLELHLNAVLCEM